jgi:hypothetical protein
VTYSFPLIGRPDTTAVECSTQVRVWGRAQRLGLERNGCGRSSYKCGVAKPRYWSVRDERGLSGTLCSGVI